MPVALILAWAAAFIAGTLMLKVGGHTIDKIVTEVGDVAHEAGDVVRETGSTVRTALDPKVLILLIIGAALVMGVVKFRR